MNAAAKQARARKRLARYESGFCISHPCTGEARSPDERTSANYAGPNALSVIPRLRALCEISYARWMSGRTLVRFFSPRAESSIARNRRTPCPERPAARPAKLSSQQMNGRVRGRTHRSPQQRKIVQWALAYLAGAFALFAGRRSRRPAFRLSRCRRACAHRSRSRSDSSPRSCSPGITANAASSVSAASRFRCSRCCSRSGGGFLWRVSVSNRAADAPSSSVAAESAVPSLGATSTAVLPFVNMSADKANEYFSTA